MDRRSLVRRAAYAVNRLGVTPIDSRTELLNQARRLADPDGSKGLARAVQGKVVLVTGASSGIGRATAVHLASAGGLVILVARSEDKLWDAHKEITASGGTAYVHPCDLLDLEQVDSLVKEVLAEHGRVDILVNSAGLSIRRNVKQSAERFHDFERPMALNYFAAIRLTLGLLPAMKAQRFGQVVNVSSWAVQVRPARFSGYTASKAALEAWSDCVQAEVLDQGIIFTNARMPLVRTPMIAPTKIYAKVPALSPEQAAEAIGSAIVRRARRVSPLVASFLTIAEAVSPRAADRIRNSAI